jgi:hypothetical protein
MERGALVCGYMISLVALDLVLWVILRRVVRMAFIVEIPRMHFNDGSRDTSGLGIPDDMIADFEFLFHLSILGFEQGLLEI